MVIEEYEEWEGFDPQEWEGVVVNRDAADIPKAVEEEKAWKGRFELWEFQSRANHEHRFIGAMEKAMTGEPELSAAWAKTLRERFPDKTFVIEIEPFLTMTWYEATADAPTEDQAEFEDFRAKTDILFATKDIDPLEIENRNPEAMRRLEAAIDSRKERVGSIGPCEKCISSEGFSEPIESPDHRGLRLMECRACHATLIHSTRTIRDRVRPG